MPKPVTAGWSRSTTLPEWLREAQARKEFRHRPEGDGRATKGLLHGEEIWSGGEDKALGDDLDVPRLRDGTPPDPVYRHVEGKVAARMRRGEMTEAELALDNTVCGTNARDQDAPWSCERLLASILPKPSRLTVWVTRDGGRTWWRRDYIGTAERIKR